VQADARLWLPALADQSVDLILTDPPYRFDRGGTYFRDWFPMLDDSEWPAVFAQLYRILRVDRHCYVLADHRVRPVFDEAARQAGFRVLRPLIWDKDWPGLGHGAWRPQYEYVCLYSKGTRRGNRNGLGDVLRHRKIMRGYPTEKPVALLEALIRQSTQQGETVLDPFAGSGNTGVAARRLRRRALLCDLADAADGRALRLEAAALEREADLPLPLPEGIRARVALPCADHAPDDHTGDDVCAFEREP
jgi:site-specific DNA-methyltransferase (adenine-specific)